MEWFVHRLRSLALFDLLELAGKLTVLVAVIFWFLEADNRAKERHYRAWELINTARGSTGDGGRRDAVQDLNRDGVSLEAAPLQQAWLSRVDLKGANLQGAFLGGANLQGAALSDANLQGADLAYSKLQDAALPGTNLQDASLVGANLQGAFLVGANLRGTDLSNTNLQGATLTNTNHLQGAFLVGADLRGVNLNYTNLRGVNLDRADLDGADLRYARNLTQEQLNAAKGDDRTQLPAGLTRPAHWSKTEAPEGQPAAQPDDAKKAPAAQGAPGSDK